MTMFGKCMIVQITWKNYCILTYCQLLRIYYILLLNIFLNHGLKTTDKTANILENTGSLVKNQSFYFLKIYNQDFVFTFIAE